jgi:hypothetical protein
MAAGITEAAKQVGAEAFGRAMRVSVAELLEDEALFPVLGALWDCASVEELQAHVSAQTRGPAASVDAILRQKAHTEYLAAVVEALGVAPSAPVRTQTQRRTASRAVATR